MNLIFAPHLTTKRNLLLRWRRTHIKNIQTFIWILDQKESELSYLLNTDIYIGDGAQALEFCLLG